MNLSSQKVYEILKSNGVNYLHHANSVHTSCQFLRHGALLSRGTVVTRGLTQTPQYTDDIDKNFGIWNDVFTDSVDIHERAKRFNYYGPVLFVLDIDNLKGSDGHAVWVTKSNPTKWSANEDGKRWFKSIEDLSDNFVRGNFDQMIVFRNCGGELTLKNSLVRIVLDDPQQVDKASEKSYFNLAKTALESAMSKSGIKTSIVPRKCAPSCSCTEIYEKESERAKTMFL